MIILDYIHQGIQSAYEGVLKDIQRVMKCPIYAHYPHIKQQKLCELQKKRHRMVWVSSEFGHSVE